MPVCFWYGSQTKAIISFYTITLLAFITQTDCLLCGTNWVFIYNSVNLIIWRAYEYRIGEDTTGNYHGLIQDTIQVSVR